MSGRFARSRLVVSSQSGRAESDKIELTVTSQTCSGKAHNLNANLRAQAGVTLMTKYSSCAPVSLKQRMLTGCLANTMNAEGLQLQWHRDGNRVSDKFLTWT
jgi:hypothetical protein